MDIEQPKKTDGTLSDDDLRKLWTESGGNFHGPHVETGFMSEAKLLPLLRGLLMRKPTQSLEISGGGEPFDDLPDLIVGAEDFMEDLATLKAGTRLYAKPSPNKADVPTHYYAKNSTVWWYRKTENDMYYWDFTDEDNYIYGWKKHIQGGDINHDKWLEENLKPLPPLKDDQTS